LEGIQIQEDNEKYTNIIEDNQNNDQLEKNIFKNEKDFGQTKNSSSKIKKVFYFQNIFTLPLKSLN